MISGIGNRGRATLPVTFRLPAQPNVTIEFVIDTGFTEYLTLPQAAVSAMKLPFLYSERAGLADGSDVLLDVYGVTISWHGQERKVRVIATGRRPLLGTALMDDQELRVQFRENGLVSIEEL
ncbi:MAG: clan AA aspartic protease [Janthinobacterium lividum]